MKDVSYDPTAQWLLKKCGAENGMKWETKQKVQKKEIFGPH